MPLKPLNINPDGEDNKSRVEDLKAMVEQPTVEPIKGNTKAAKQPQPKQASAPNDMSMQVNGKTISILRPQYDIISSVKKYGLCLGGQGSGKTYIMSIITAQFASQFPHIRGFVGANTKGQLGDSTLRRIRETWKDLFGWEEYDEKTNPTGNYVEGRIPPPHFKTDHHNIGRDRYGNKICFDNGHMIVKGSMEAWKAIDGQEFAYALLDETKDTREEAIKDVIFGRVRQPGIFIDYNIFEYNGKRYKVPYFTPNEFNDKGEKNQAANPIRFFTSPAKVQWLNELFDLSPYKNEIKQQCTSTKGDYWFKNIAKQKMCVVYSVYCNKHNLPDNWIEDREDIFKGDIGRQLMLIHGYPFGSTGDEFWPSFNQEIHVNTAADIQGFKWSKNIHLTYDQNTKPYMSCLAAQIFLYNTTEQYQHYLVHIFDEICTEPPRNVVADNVEEFKDRWLRGEMEGLFQGGILYYGDVSMKRQSTLSRRMKDGSLETGFSIVKQAFISYRPKGNDPDRSSSANPSVSVSGDFVNTLMGGGIAGLKRDENGNIKKRGLKVDFLIHPRCKNFIDDLIYVEKDTLGNMLKPKNSEGVEERGHLSDAFRYFVVRAFSYFYINYSK